MSDTDAMVRLMDHAADKLHVCLVATSKLSRLDNLSTEQTTAIVAAMAYARAVLQMTASSVAPEGQTLADRLRSDYSTWAEANDETNMSDGELAAIARFITNGGES